MNVSDTASLTSGIAGRYATALFELAKDAKGIDGLEGDIEALSAALDESADLRDVISSPIYTRTQQGSAISAIAEKMGLGSLVANTLALMASKRRLFVLPAMIKSVRGLIAQERGEVTAEVRSAKALSDEQKKELAKALKSAIGQDIKIDTTVDESLIGGLVVKVGSRMIDTSIRAKLNKLQNAMKEVG
ncbi:F0F1 ATP synthase subunit delta [Algicella marina]|uniref:ATP synthase subunit delta n=1 Tax=Algicella marina TaxID=2683284 RepID=A0A6P1T3Z5_9RHOB|nr:F0F1 ATP synthase subunit delta [Algicella marina]QHQ36216.1 F0F1 ATP synthase subunit delta [Algicella marina]